MFQIPKFLVVVKKSIPFWLESKQTNQPTPETQPKKNLKTPRKEKLNKLTSDKTFNPLKMYN